MLEIAVVCSAASYIEKGNPRGMWEEGGVIWMGLGPGDAYGLGTLFESAASIDLVLKRVGLGTERVSVVSFSDGFYSHND